MTDGAGQTDKVPAVETYLAENDALRDVLGVASQAVLKAELLARGEYNENYLFEHPETGAKLVFRINLGSQMHLEDQIGYEARALQLLEQSGRTPKVLYADGSKQRFDAGILVEEWLPGRPLRYETDLEAAACVLADIHSVKVPSDHGLVEPAHPLHGIIDECAAMFSRYVRWDAAEPALLKRIERWFELAEEAARIDEPGKHIVNTEVNSGNFLIGDGSSCAASYLVDWEKPLVAPVEQDLAHFLVPTTTFWKTDSILSQDGIDVFVGYYRKAVAGRFNTDGLADRLSAFMRVTCLRGITWCAMALAQHLGGQRSVADAYTLAKITEYLETDFLDTVERRYYS